ncbi:MAG: sorbosone dehydrogenase family protein, partial [Deltaproteobacteria bacterium]
MRRATIPIVALAGLVLSCGTLLKLLPERYAVNVPLDSVLGFDRDAPPQEAFGGQIRVPRGFSIGLFADGIDNARFLRFTDAGDLLVSAPRFGRVMLVERDADRDGRADGARILLEGLNRPHGIDLRDGWLYVAETDAIGRVRFDADHRALAGSFERIVTDLPSGGNHWTRTLRFGPDGWMYVSIGSSCNACVEENPTRASILRYRPDGTDPQIFATGLRNSVGFDWRPGTNELFATDNGRDLLGDDLPPCELNRIVENGFYGWPYAYGDRVPDPQHGAGNEQQIASSIAPMHAFRAHTAPLGITFVRGDGVPPAYRGAALVALHGSWNRTEKDGYEVVSLHWDASGAITERRFVGGFEVDEDVIGRPVDVAEGPDGAFYISDDYAGVIYRVAYGEAAPASVDPRARRAPTRVRTPLDGPGFVQRGARGAALYAAHRCAQCHEGSQAPPGIVAAPLQSLGERY